jgi:transposase-like protein
MRSVNHQASVIEWRELIAECRRSGKSVKDWCAENSIMASKYYYWLRVIRNEALVLANNQISVPQPQFAEVKVKSAICKGEVDDTEGKICATLEFDSFSLKINNGANVDTLEYTLRVLKDLC